MKNYEMTEEELFALPVSVPLVTAGRALGMGRTKAHELARAGTFPCRVLRLGAAYQVPKVELIRLLGLEDEYRKNEQPTQFAEAS